MADICARCGRESAEGEFYDPCCAECAAEVERISKAEVRKRQRGPGLWNFIRDQLGFPPKYV